MTKTLIVLSAAALLIAGCRRDATVPAERSRDSTTIQPGEESATRQAAGVLILDGWQVYGEPVSTELPHANVADVLAQPASFAGRDVQLQGTISEVCQEKGCWLRIADPSGGEETVFVKFTCPVDGEYLIPKDAAGKPVVVQGQVVVEEMDEATARHMAEDSGRSPAEIEAIKGPQKVIRVMSPSAKVKV